MKNWDEITVSRIIIVIAILALVISLFTGCVGTYYVAEYDDRHPVQVYYHNELPYWGYYSGHYYYYGIPHYYPWWYYYTLMPNYTYDIHTHVHVHLDRGKIVKGPRGPKFDNSSGRTYKPNRHVTVKPNINTGRTIIKTNTNRTNVKTNVNKNTNRTNIKVNTNRTNVKTNNRSNRTNNRSNIKRTPR